MVVTDGFSGNIALKTAEGTARFVTDLLRRAFTSSLRSKAGFALSKPALNLLKVHLDPNNHNGAVFLGLNGLVVKSHGGANYKGVANAIGVAASMVRNDITRKIAARALGRRLALDERVLEEIRAKFLRLGRKMPEINSRQAMVMEGAEVLDNPHGSAPGMYVERGGRAVVLLPGPPREMKPMFEKHVLPRLAERAGGVRVVRRVLRDARTEAYYRFEELEGRQVLRYAIARRMEQECLACHNHMAESPKKDWKEGDVGGVIEIGRRLGTPAASGPGMIAALTLMAASAVTLAAFVAATVRRRSP